MKFGKEFDQDILLQILDLIIAYKPISIVLKKDFYVVNTGNYFNKPFTKEFHIMPFYVFMKIPWGIRNSEMHLPWKVLYGSPVNIPLLGNESIFYNGPLKVSILIFYHLMVFIFPISYYSIIS